MFVLRQPLIGLAVDHGEFGDEGALAASRALGGFALGLGAFSIYFFVLRAFYAHQDTRSAFVVNLVENIINIVLAVALVGSFGVLGLGAAYAIAYAIAGLWVLQILSYKVPGFSVRWILGSLWRMIVAAALMGEVVWLVTREVGGNTGIDAALRLAVGTVVGVLVYGLLLLAMGAPELAALRRRLPGRASAAAQ